MKGKAFTVTEDHVKLLQAMYVGWDDCEYGAPSIDPKRPYGDSMVDQNICEILGWKIKDPDEGPSEAQSDKARKIHEEMETVLQILLVFATKGIKPGKYQQHTDYQAHSWEKVK